MVGHLIGEYQYCEPVVGTAGAVTKAGTAYSEAVNVSKSEGFQSFVIASTAGSITVTLQGSMNGTTFYDVEGSDGSALGALVAAMTVGTKAIQAGAIAFPYIRLKVVEGNVAATVVTVKMAMKRTAR